MDPSTIQSLLVQQLAAKQGQPGTQGSGATTGQGSTSGANLLAQLAQKAMLMKALQSSQNNQQQQTIQQGQTQLAPGINAQAQALGQVQPGAMDAQTAALMAQNPVMPPVLPQDQ